MKQDEGKRQLPLVISRGVIALLGVASLSACGTVDRMRDSVQNRMANAADNSSGPEAAEANHDAGFKRRFYIGGGILASQLDPDASEIEGVEVDEKSSAGGSLAAGLDVGNRFSIEGHLAMLGEATLAPEEYGEVGYTVGGLSGIIYLLNSEEMRALREGFNVYGRLGVGMMSNSTDDELDYERVNDFHMLAGIGLEYGMSNGLGLRAEYVSHDTDANYAQLGLVYRFGDAYQRGVVQRAPLPETRTQAPPEPAPAPKPAAPVPLPTPVPAPSPTRTADQDTDGVPDNRDQCADTPAGRPVNEVGCEIFAGAIEGINFESGSDRLTPSAQGILAGVARTLQAYPGIRVSIEAHTDNQGSGESNLQLSKQRAIAVARYLVQSGVDAKRLRPAAFGESRPRAENATPEGRARNRRVEFKVID